MGVHVPDVPEGRYILSFRWESEQTNQIWNSCGDVTIKSSGAATEPFTPTVGCDPCLPEKIPVCSNCTGCLKDKTGDCAYCWNTLPGYNPTYAPDITCLGHGAPDGGAKPWKPGDSTEGGWSPGCPKLSVLIFPVSHLVELRTPSYTAQKQHRWKAAAKPYLRISSRHQLFLVDLLRAHLSE